MSHHIFEPRSSFGIHQKRKKDASSLSPATSIITFELLPNPDWSDKIFIASHDINPVSDREIPHNEKPLFGGTLSTAASTATEAKNRLITYSETKSSCSSLQQKTRSRTWWLSHPSLLLRSNGDIYTCNQQRVSIRCSCKCSHYLTSPLTYDLDQLPMVVCTVNKVKAIGIHWLTLSQVRKNRVSWSHRRC